MKEEALKLAVWLENMSKLGWADNFGQELDEISAMIRRLVEEVDYQNTIKDNLRQQLAEKLEELDKQTKPLSDKEIWELHQEHIDEIPCGHSMKTIGFVEFARAIEERHGIK